MGRRIFVIGAVYGAVRRAFMAHGGRVYASEGCEPETLKEVWSSRPLLGTETAALVAVGALQGAVLAPVLLFADLRAAEARARGIALDGGGKNGGKKESARKRRTSPVDFAFE